MTRSYSAPFSSSRYLIEMTTASHLFLRRSILVHKHHWHQVSHISLRTPSLSNNLLRQIHDSRIRYPRYSQCVLVTSTFSGAANTDSSTDRNQTLGAVLRAIRYSRSMMSTRCFVVTALPRSCEVWSASSGRRAMKAGRGL